MEGILGRNQTEWRHLDVQSGHGAPSIVDDIRNVCPITWWLSISNRWPNRIYTHDMNVLSAFVEQARQGYIKTNRPHVIVHSADQVRHSTFVIPSIYPVNSWLSVNSSHYYYQHPSLHQTPLTLFYSSVMVICSHGQVRKPRHDDP